MRITLCREFRDAMAFSKALSSHLLAPAEMRKIRGLATDSGEVEEGDIFLALPGKRRYGWDFAGEALARGAVGILAPEGVRLPEGAYYRFLAEDPQNALFRAVAARRAHLSGKVIAVSGSAGKTTLKEILGAVLGESGVVYKSNGNFNSTIGMPLSFLSMEKGDYHILELGISHPGEMEPMSKALSPDIAILTNVGSAHIGNYGSFWNLLSEKEKISAGLSENGVFLLPENLQLVRQCHEKTHVYRYGSGMNCDFCAENIHMSENGIVMDVRHGTHRYENLTWNIPGGMGVSLLTAAAGLAMILHVPFDAFSRGVARSMALTPRMCRISAGKRLLLNDTYNASPETVITALETLHLLAGKRQTVAVLGDILELGDFSQPLHDAVGECIGKSPLSLLFTYGEKASGIADGARRAGMAENRIFSFLPGDEEELASAVTEVSEKNAVILLKASHGMALWKVTELVERNIICKE